MDLRGDLRNALNNGMRKITQWADGHGAADAMFEAQKFDPFFNVNTFADLDAAKAIIDTENL